MKVHIHTKFCLICLLTFIFHHCNHCHEDHDHGPEELHRHHRGMTESESSKFSVQDAENEKKYYIEKLFDRYGENGRLSFFGLEKLLTNLGLGEIKVVEINHEDLGHDHVSHLDILAVQEGKHFHSHTHQHFHNHLNAENHTTTSVTSKRNHKCDPEKEAAELPIKADDKHLHDRNHRFHHRHRLHHHLDHNTTRHVHNDSVAHSEHGEPGHSPSPETNKTQEQSEVNNMSITGFTNLTVYIALAILMRIFLSTVVMSLAMDTKNLILIMKVNFDILESEKHHMLEKVQFIPPLATKTRVKTTASMNV